MLLKLNAKLAPGWALIQVNFDPIQEIGPKVGGGRSFVSGPFFARLRYFVVNAVDESKVCCKICEESVLRGGRSTKL